MKKSIYAISGSAMITAAVLVRSIADGGSELVALLLIGAVMLVASADVPANQRRGTR